MAWNPLEQLKKKFGTGAPEPKAAPVPGKLVEAAQAGKVPDLKELEKKGLLGQFFRHWKNPAFLKQLKAVTARMQADGVDLKDQSAVKKWVEAHQKDLQEGKLDSPVQAPPKPFVKSGPDQGRNDACACGSGKKFKKCCGR